MKRILFVDDEPKVLESLQDLLHKHRRNLKMVFATGGERALAELRSDRFDVVVSDMRMPGIDGATLLARVKEDYPDTIRIILSGQADRNAVFNALPVCHQFLAKPCDAETLYSAIERTCRLRDVLPDESLRKRIGSLDRLPSRPTVQEELIDALSQSDVSMMGIAAIVERDIGLSAKVLQLANSAFFGTASLIARIDRAVAHLGTEMLRKVASTMNVFAAPAGGPTEAAFESLQEHAMRTARLAKQLLPVEHQAQQAFAAALLHDVGQLVYMICVPEIYARLIEISHSTGRPLHEIETANLGVTHATVGAYMLGMWGLPIPIVDAVAHHHNIAITGEIFDVASATAVADSLDRLPAFPAEVEARFDAALY